MHRDWDLDALAGFFAPDAVWDLSGLGWVNCEGWAAIRVFLEEWWSNWEDHDHKIEEILDLSHGGVFVAHLEDGRPTGTGGRVQARRGNLFEWAQGKIVQITSYTDIDEARAAAERLVEERGQAMSEENVRLVERAIAAINARDIDAYLACCTENVELLQPLVGAQYLGADGIRRFFTDIEDIGPDFRIEVQRVQAIGDSNAIAFVRVSATGRASGIVTGAESANVYDFTEGKIRRIRIFLDRSEALKAVGLAE